MTFDEIIFPELTKNEYIRIKKSIVNQINQLIEESEPNHVLGSLEVKYKITALHQIYNKLRNKKNCHVLTKPHQDSFYFIFVRERMWKALQKYLVEEKEKEQKNVGCST